MTAKTIRVHLTASTADKSYDIHVGAGLLAHAGELITPFLQRSHVTIITDEEVAPHHLPTLQKSLTAANITHSHKILPCGESVKNFNQLNALCGWLLDEKIERRDMIIALGGGVVGDLTGFAAAILRRGVDFIQIPTTLLAQVDSSVGGKTAINVPQGKNLIGAFHQPRFVLADIETLKTLPTRQIKAGYAEVVKYAALGDAGFFTWLDQNLVHLMAGKKHTLISAIAKSCAAKAAIVAADERENNVRALLNLGHTFAHAYEAVTGYSDALLHGEAVGLGLIMAFELSVQLGYCTPEDAARLAAHLRQADLCTAPSQIKGAPFDTDALLAAMAQDKKVTDGKMTFILAHGIGDAFIANNIDTQAIRELLNKMNERSQ